MEHTFTTANFEEEVLKSDVPVLVDFYADWCGPCKMMGPVVEEFANAYDGKVKVGKLNVDEQQEIAMKYGVMSIPTFLFVKDGEVKDTAVGAMDKNTLKARIDQLLA